MLIMGYKYLVTWNPVLEYDKHDYIVSMEHMFHTIIATKNYDKIIYIRRTDSKYVKVCSTVRNSGSTAVKKFLLKADRAVSYSPKSKL